MQPSWAGSEYSPMTDGAPLGAPPCRNDREAASSGVVTAKDGAAMMSGAADAIFWIIARRLCTGPSRRSADAQARRPRTTQRISIFAERCRARCWKETGNIRKRQGNGVTCVLESPHFLGD